MYLEHFQLTHSPFREEPDPEVFFPGARREEVCQSLILDVLAGRPLVKLIGREGSGKTLICQVVIDRLPAEYKVVYIDNPAGAFDDLLRIACLDLGMNPSMKHDSVNFLEELRNLLEKRRAQKTKTVLIIDEAELLAYKSLEIIRRIHDMAKIGVVLAGMPRLRANLRGKKGESKQLYSRIGFVGDLSDRLPEQDIGLLSQATIGTDAFNAKLYKACHGNARRLNKLLRGVNRLSKLNNRPIDDAMINKFTQMLID